MAYVCDQGSWLLFRDLEWLLMGLMVVVGDGNSGAFRSDGDGKVDLQGWYVLIDEGTGDGGDFGWWADLKRGVGDWALVTWRVVEVAVFFMSHMEAKT